MKKLILSLFIFCSAFASAQISIPQVTGLPAALNSKVDKVTGKSLIADTLVAKIQPHVTNTANPHSTTKAQVGLGNVDNTSDINKPISSATQTALNGKQPTGTYSTDIHSNITALNAVSGTNTGDETLTSIKTKLGAATSVSDGYLKYQDWSIFNSKEPAITKNSGFNLPLGSTPGTVLEGRTFGTAANSAVGDFVQNQNSSPQSANMWISGVGTFEQGVVANNNYGFMTAFGVNRVNPIWSVAGYPSYGIGYNQSDWDGDDIRFYFGDKANPKFKLHSSGTLYVTRLSSTVATGTAPLTVNSTTMVGNLNAQYFNDQPINNFHYRSDNYYADRDANTIIGGYGFNTTGNGTGNSNFPYGYGTVMTYDLGYGRTQLHFNHAGELTVRSKWGDSWNTNRLVWDSGNLTNTLTTNYLPKWNGSSFVNSAMADDGIHYIYINRTGYGGIKLNSSIGDNAILFENNTLADWTFGTKQGDNTQNLSIYNQGTSSRALFIDKTSNALTLSSTTPSTSPTTGALVVNGGIGADHVRANNFYGNGSNLTGVQLPITLTTNGTSGAATFSGNVLNVPNYSGSGGVDQTQIIIWASTTNGPPSGYIVCSMPWHTDTYKKVIIEFNKMYGKATYTFPVAFTKRPYLTTGLPNLTGIQNLSTTSITVESGSDSDSKLIILEGY